MRSLLHSLLPLALVFVAIVGYFVLSGSFGVFQAVPWPHYLLAGGATVWALARAAKLRRILPTMVAMLSLFLTATYAWYTLSYSAYVTTSGAEVGQQLDALTSLRLDSHEGTPAAVLAGEATLLVLYRGYW